MKPFSCFIVFQIPRRLVGGKRSHSSTTYTWRLCGSSSRHQLALFTLESLMNQLFIRSISVQMPSMQDVFMK